MGESEFSVETGQQVIDVRQILLRHLIHLYRIELEEEHRLDTENHARSRLFNDLSNIDEMEEIKAMVTPVMLSCGEQHFMLEALVSCPAMGMEMFDRRLFVISATDHDIVWMGDSFEHMSPPLARLWPESHLSSHNKHHHKSCAFSFSQADSVYVGHYTISTDGKFSMEGSPMMPLDSSTQLNHDLS